ncbi:MAG: Crp/Fnr family transcriptional regulator [Bacteroidetes bacterium]|nr:Crp/Fnr family transcriptional regulator [Bacteroidota bacterium]MBS1610588.1 Crp/Fnr family transcriptional regulator [Bacteroidota bacterium]
MAEELILKNIAKYIRLDKSEQDYFLSVVKKRKIKKKQFLSQEGDISKGPVFVTRGILRSYTVDKNGFEHILQFAPSGWWIADMYSMVTQKPGQLSIDAIEDSEVFLLPKPELEKLYITIPSLERFFRILAENSLITYQQRIIGSLSETAKERYNNFCKTYPSLIECLPQKQVASYIGVTPEFLSKMLKNKNIS